MSVFTARRFNRHEVCKQSASIVDNSYRDFGYGFNGSKFRGGVGGLVDEIGGLDYWEMRRRSSVLFHTNMYARGIVRCLVKNIITTGLNLECIPEEAILGFEEDSLQDWTEYVENRFTIWARTKTVCDYKKTRTFFDIQRYAYREALIGGDVLVILRQDPSTNLPSIEIIPGERVQTPLIPSAANRIVDGVEVDEAGRHIAFYVDKGAGYVTDRYQRIEARGPITGRLQAWLVYGADKREDGVRGEPLLGIAIQPLIEVDRYRDYSIRKGSINSSLLGYIKKTNNTPGTLPIPGANRKSETVSNTDGTQSQVSFSNQPMPGVFIEHLGVGEEPTPYAITGSDVSFGPFEAAIIHGLAWAFGIPPENLTLEFQSNYSASQAANSEFSVFIQEQRGDFGSKFNDPVYADVFLSHVLIGKIEARGFLDAIADPRKSDIVQAWLGSDWTGAIKPSIDIVKQATGYALQIAMGVCTRDRAAREITGSKFTKVARRLAKENQQLMDANTPIFEAKKKYSEEIVDEAKTAALLHLITTRDDDDENMAPATN
jgi:capsid protein